MKKPNVLLITSDQQHYSMLGSVNSKIKTPNLDKLASEGMLFNRAYCPNPTCTPSRASILTGMYPSNHGAWSLGTKLPETTPTLTQSLRDEGYETALIGKAHFQPTKSTPEYPSLETPELFRDFEFWKNFNDDFYGFNHIELLRNHTAEQWVGQHYAMWMEDNGLKNWRDFFFKPGGTMRQRQKGTWKIPEKYHYNTWIAERTSAMLEQYKNENKPFFLWASFPDPHYPQLVPAPWDKMYKPSDMELPSFSFKEHKENPPYFRECFKLFPNFKPYRESGCGVHGLQFHLYLKSDLKKQLAYAYGMMSFMDKYIGKILDRLKELDLDNDTIVIFTTDHGDLFGQHGFRHKCIFHYEDLLRVPMIVKYPGHVNKSSRSNSLQSLVDIAPTVLSLCGISPPDYMDGTDQSDVWTDKTENINSYVICENRHEPHVLNMRSYIESRYKITVHENRSYGELYDLQTDPGEHMNLWNKTEYADLKSQLLFRFLTALMTKSSDGFIEQRIADGDFELYINTQGGCGLYDIVNDADRQNNLWNDSLVCIQKCAMLVKLISEVMEKEPMWMPRICGA